jgi:CheY-like chemotaxis protein
MAKVLIVDDEAGLRFVLRVTFELAGHSVTEAADGRSALEQVRSSRPDLVTTDFMMPVMDGGELIEQLRADPQTAAIPVLLISSSPVAARVPGADHFMEKPLDPADVLEQADALLAKESA